MRSLWWDSRHGNGTIGLCGETVDLSNGIIGLCGETVEFGIESVTERLALVTGYLASVTEQPASVTIQPVIQYKRTL